MKKQGLIKGAIAFLSGVIMLLLTMVAFKTVIPTGVAFMPLAGIVTVGLAVTLDWRLSLITTVVATVIAMLMGTADWVTLVSYLVVLLAVWLATRGQATLAVIVSHQQLRWLAIVTGLVQLFYLGIIYGVIGLVLGGTTASLTFIQQIIPLAVLTGLVYGFLVAPIALAMRWVAKKLLHIDDHHNDDSQGNDGRSVIVDLSDHQDKDK